MNVKFPKGFLATLSEKCLKELQEKAKMFEYEYELENSKWQDIYLNSDGETVQTVDGPIVFKKTAYCRNSIIGNIKGFSLKEGSFISDITLRIIELEAKEKELNELKKSIESIKNAFK